MNYLQLCGELAREGGLNSGVAPASVTSANGETANIAGWIRNANADIQGMYFDWKFLWNTIEVGLTAGQTSVAAPANWHYWDRKQALIDGKPNLRLVERELWDGYLDGQTGRPHTLLIQPDGSLRAYPEPTTTHTLTLEYYRSPQQLASDADEPLIPSAFHDVIWLLALFKYGYYESAPEVIERARAEFFNRMTALEANQLPGRHRYGLAYDADPLVVVPE